MNKIYVTGHKKPDTDSVASAIALANLKRELGFDAEAFVLGNLNYETKFILDKFGFEEPTFLDNVKLQLKDTNYQKGLNIEFSNSIFNTFKYMKLTDSSVIPITSSNSLVGIVSMKDIAAYSISDDSNYLNTSFTNIIETIEGNIKLSFSAEIKGKLVIASYQHNTLIESDILDENSILIVGNRNAIIEHAINKKVKLIIITGSHSLKDEHLTLAEQNKINIIYTDYDTFKTAKYVIYSNYIDDITLKDNIVKFNQNDFVSEFVEIANKTKYSNYPVVDSNNTCLGLAKLSHMASSNKKKVILVDHNEIKQSVDGLEEADIVEIIDHHNISSLGTSTPINYRVMPIACTCTILYLMYKEHNIKIDKKLAGLMASAIISDTLLLKSPTTTNLDINALKELSEVAGINYESYGLEMLKAGSSLKGRSIEDIVLGDFKNFTVGSHKLGIGQISTFNIGEIKSESDKYINVINEVASKNEYKILAFFATDILTNGSYLFYNNDAEHLIKDAYNIDNLHQGIYLEGVVSRKKQMAPKLISKLEQK